MTSLSDTAPFALRDVPDTVACELSEMAKDCHEADDGKVDRGEETKYDDVEGRDEGRTIPKCDAGADEDRHGIERQHPNGQLETDERRVELVPCMRRVGDERRDDEEKELKDQVKVELAERQQKEEAHSRPPEGPVGAQFQGWDCMANGDLSPSLSPTQSLSK